jgi:ectoine hydroxylase-related dioxygenase (phytanoyl-CoA dioxygenase family)
MALAMTPDQERDFDERGFVVLEDFLTPGELARLSAAADEVVGRIQREKGLGAESHFQVRNALAHHDAFLDLVDHPRILPLVVDAIGWNIQIRTTHLDYRPPYPEDLREGEVGVGKGADQEAGYRNVAWHPDLASPELFQAPSLDGRLPFMEIKVFYPLFDMTESDCGNLWLAPGSHKRTPRELTEMGRRVPEEQTLELKLRAGSAVLWRTAVWHCVGPNLSDKTRKIIHVGYHYRWLRPTDYIQQDAELLKRCSPIRQQLLGALPSGADPLGEDPEVAPSSQYWLTKNSDDVPLRAWAESLEREGSPIS